MAIAHLIVGGVFLVLFLLTGVYMLDQFPELYKNREEVRMMYRATHIYLLFAALLNLLSWQQFKSSPFVFGGNVRSLASVLIALSPLILFVAFCLEPASYMIERPIGFWGVVCAFVGVMLHTALQIPLVRRLVGEK